MTLLGLLAAALAYTLPPRVIEVTVTGPSGTPVLDWEGPTPMEAREIPVDAGGVPYVVVVEVRETHDSVTIEAVVYELKGGKGKRTEVARPKLTLYEDYPGSLRVESPVPRKYAGPPVAALEWTMEAVWHATPPAAPAGSGPPPAAAPTAAPDPATVPAPVPPGPAGAPPPPPPEAAARAGGG